MCADTPGGNEVDKGALGPHLAAPVQRVFYMTNEGRQDQEVYPQPNPSLLAELETCDAVLYGMGSLYTSICPSLILQVKYTGHTHVTLTYSLHALHIACHILPDSSCLTHMLPIIHAVVMSVADIHAFLHVT